NIPEGKIILDAPVYDHLDRSLAQSRVYVINTQNLKKESGIENLRIDVVTAGPLVEDHVRTTIFLNGVEDCWIRDVTALNFSYALVDMRNTTRVTVTGCAALLPHSPILGARRYNFNVSSRTNNILFTNNTASEGRHTFVSNGASSAAGIVFTNSSSDRDLNPSEGHRRWSQGLLFDNLLFTNSNTVNLLNLYNRGDFGTGHGWSSVHSVAWNVTTPGNRGMIIQKPPGRQNYAIGCKSNVTGNFRFVHPAGFIELTNQIPAIPSLYDAQLAQRLATGPLPDAPARLTAVADMAAGTATLEWLDIAADETGYEISVSSPFFTDRVLDTISANSTTYLDESGVVADFATLTYRVTALGTNGPSPYSNPVTVEGAASVREARATELRVYPNPVTDRLWLDTKLRLRSIAVFDAAGRRVLSTTQVRFVDTRRWTPGCYYLKAKTFAGEQLSLRIVKK
ncbi:MAG: T9SS type A sorting domain-containing protein, partial [Bacteroidota bacterium]